MNLKITTRLSLWYLAFFGTAVILIAISRHLIFIWGEEERLDNQGKAYAAILLSNAVDWKAPIPMLTSSLDSINRHAPLPYRSLRFFLHDDKQVFYDNEMEQNIPPLLDSLHVRIAGQTGFKTVEFASETYRTYTVIPTTTESRDKGLKLTIVIPQEAFDATVLRLRILLAIGVVLLLIIAWIGGLFLSRRSLSLVEQIRRTAAEITGTNLARRVPVGKAQDELAALARTFNDMIERLDRYAKSYRNFVTNTSHDLRTPLTTIRTELQMAIEENETQVQAREVMQRCLKQLDRLDRLTGDLMFIARVDADGVQLTTQPIQLDELLLECATDIQILAQKKNITLDVSLPEEPPVECVCDEYLMRRAVVNLLDNAVNYSPPGSTVRLGLEGTDTEKRITVADNGPGMTQEEMERAVERLYRGPSSHGTAGSGLGLAIAREIIQAHGGRLVIDSAPGRGTSITLFCPAAASSLIRP